MACQCGNDLFEVDYISTSYGICFVKSSGDVSSISEKGSDNFDYDSDFTCTKCEKKYDELPES